MQYRPLDLSVFYMTETCPCLDLAFSFSLSPSPCPLCGNHITTPSFAFCQGTQAAQWVAPSSPWAAQRRTWSMCGLYTTSPAAMQRTFPSRRERYSSSWRSQKSSGGAPRVKRGVSEWSLCPTWRNWYDLRLTPASLPMDHATPTVMGSPSPPTPSFTPTPSHRHLRRCPLAHLEQSSPLYRPCRTALSWRRPSKNGCRVPMTKQLLL